MGRRARLRRRRTPRHAPKLRSRVNALLARALLLAGLVVVPAAGAQQPIVIDFSQGVAPDGVRRSVRTRVITLTPNEGKSWKKALVPLYRQMEGSVGKALIESICKETGFDPDRL